MKTIQECLPGRFANLPERVLQFGEGNFLRAFADWMIELSNRRGELNGSVVICQPLARGAGATLNAQNCRYTVVMRGLEGGGAWSASNRSAPSPAALTPTRTMTR